ncbi:MAG: tail fiber domain-containing protein, partial [candidate division Zixibacteria bacterium]
RFRMFSVNRTICLTVAALLILASVSLGVPNSHTVYYQAELRDNLGNPIDTTIQMMFHIYDAETGGTSLWNETQPSVAVVTGIFSVYLGSVNTLSPSVFAGQDNRYLGVTVGGDSEMIPRSLIAAVPSAMRAGIADDVIDTSITESKLRGKSVSREKLADKAVGKGQLGDTAVSRGKLMDKAVGRGQLGDTAISRGKIADKAVGRGQVGDTAVGKSQLGHGSVDSAKIENGSIAFEDIAQNFATSGQVMKWNGSAWAADNDNTGATDGDWTITGNAVYTASPWGIARAGSSLMGPNDSTMVSLGAASTAGDSTNATSKYCTVSGGYQNYAGGISTTVGGGYQNAATGLTSNISGGFGNIITGLSGAGKGSVVAGGYYNQIDGIMSAIGGGRDNSVAADSSVISGGTYNSIAGFHGAVGGGFQNDIDGTGSTISGGIFNQVYANKSSIGGGESNGINNGTYGVIGGGHGNNISYPGPSPSVNYSVVAGGHDNQIEGSSSVIGGGGGNEVNGIYATIAGGSLGHAREDYSTIGGGLSDTAKGPYSTVGGGRMNVAYDIHCTIGGGNMNEAQGTGTVIAGGVQNSVGNDFGSILGGQNNSISGSMGTIVGGENNKIQNSSASFGSIGGGSDNTANGDYATIGGGLENQANGDSATVGGGYFNRANAPGATVSGGATNVANSQYATICGGSENAASGTNATVCGGNSNLASGTGSLAAGTDANAIDDNSFVWSSGSAGPVSSVNSAHFVAQADRFWFGDNTSVTYSTGRLIETSTGAYLSSSGTWQSVSDANSKENFEPVDGDEILSQIAELPISKWNYINDPEANAHIGPTAQDFYATFEVGEDDKTISALDPTGVALAGIQELYRQNQKLAVQTEQQSKLIEELQQKLSSNGELKEEIAQLRAMFEALLNNRSTETETK